MFMSERQKMISGLPYDPGDPELQADQTAGRSGDPDTAGAVGALGGGHHPRGDRRCTASGGTPCRRREVIGVPRCS